MNIEMVIAGRKEPVATTAPDAASADAARLLSDKRIGLLVVCDAGGAIVGVLSERDIVRGLSDHGAGLSRKKVADLMTGDVLTCSPGDSVIQILEIMSERRIRHVPVVEDGNLVGMVSIRDLMQHMLKHDAARIKDMMMSIYEKSGAYPWA